MPDTDRSPLLRYSVAVLSVALITVIRLLLHSLLGAYARFLPFFLAVTFSSWYGGLGPGLLATVLAVVIANTLILEPVGRPPFDFVQTALFGVVGAVISYLNDSLKSQLAERRHAEQASKAQVQALTQVIERLAQEHDLAQLQGLVLAAIVKQLDAEGGALWRYDEETDASEVVLVYQEGRVLAAEAAGHPLAGQEIESREFPGMEEIKAGYLRGECVQVLDLKSDPRLPERFRAGLLQVGVKRLLMVPMLLQGRLTGFYTVRNSRPASYGRHELQLAQALAHQATLALQLSRLAAQARQTAILGERTRMAGEIHDGLGQAFTGILLQLGALELLLADRSAQERGLLESARDLAREGLTEARRSAHALRPQALEQMDLAAALQRMTAQLSTDPATPIPFRLHGEPRPLPAAVADHLLRIGQEALTNALRHAQASEVCAELTFTETELRLCVSDDGKGFAVHAPHPKEGFGLTGMHERAGLIGARLTVDSQPGSGTRIELTWQFPLGEQQRDS